MSKGKIFLVGFGPGSQEHMSYRARQAIAESDVVIGYSTYIKLVADLLEGKEVVRKGMTEELDRSIEAFAQAKQGKTVALVSSGDIGIYGMAGPTYEVLLQSGWTPQSEISVEIVPGSTALSACASLVGAPLTHDFCSISLSDLLTPWPTIARRIEAAARGDFVVALYNPKSGRRTGQIVEAQEILLRHRDPATPVAIVKSAYRDAQDIQMVRLDQMSDCKIGMLSTVLIGNSSTFVQAGLMITPRGYANKYDQATGAVKEGEKAGRSLSMGLDGWKGYVRDYLRRHSAITLREAADYFDAPLGEVLDAVAQATRGDEAGDYRAACIANEQIETVLQSLRHWGPLDITLHSEGGATTTLRVSGNDLAVEGRTLAIDTPHLQLRSDGARVAAAWLVQGNGQLRGIELVDIDGNAVVTITLQRLEGRLHPEAQQQFDSSWQRFATQPLEHAGNE